MNSNMMNQSLTFCSDSSLADCLDVTAPDLDSLGNGVDAVESCNKLARQGHSLVGQLQMAGHVMMGLWTVCSTGNF